MSMHMIQGVQVHGTSHKRKSRNKTKSLLKAEAALAKYYAKLGVGKTNLMHTSIFQIIDHKVNLSLHLDKELETD